MPISEKILKSLRTVDPSVAWESKIVQECSFGPYGVIPLGGTPIVKFPKDDGELDEFMVDYEKTSHLLCLPTSEEVDEILTRIKTEPVSLDIETNSLSPFKKGTKIIAFSVALTDKSFSFPASSPFVSEESASHFIETMLQIFETACYIIMFNGNYDLTYLHHKYPDRIHPEKIHFNFDPMIAAHIYSGAAYSEYNLGFLSKKYVKAKAWKGGPGDWLAATFARTKDRTYDRVPAYILLPYARRDAYYTMELYKVLRASLEQDDMMNTYNEVHEHVRGICYRMHWDGMWVDKFMIEGLDVRYEKKAIETECILKEIIAERIKILDDEADSKTMIEALNLNSPKQMSLILYDILGVPILDRTAKTGDPKTGTTQVLKIATFDPPVFAVFNAYKKWDKNRGYLQNYVNFTGQIGGDPEGIERVVCHSDFSPIGTRTGRLASSKPNGQNISVGSGLKSVFISPDRSLMINAIYEDLLDKGMPTKLAHECRNYREVEEDIVLVDDVIEEVDEPELMEDDE